jgi:acetyltransferase, GNAT family
MGHLEHTYPQWKCVIEDALLSGGGYAQEGVIRLLEGGECSQFVATQLPIKEGLAYHQVVTPPLGKGLKPHGMMRVVKIPQLLALYAKKHPNVEWQFDLFDAMLRPNTGRYRLEKGKCLFTPLSPKSLQKNILTPSLLLEQLFAENPFYIDLMLD